ncbi:Na+/H+ antiporter subunit E [Anaerosolibacter sp.]|uniref:Na+/H+ antiporter subunit E n=1 Tax=Anaerosolibacter sp. TaxID=1872527 RepID=UPI0039EEBEAE
MRMLNGRMQFFLFLIVSWFIFTLDVSLENAFIGIIVSGIITLMTLKIFSDLKADPFSMTQVYITTKFLLRLIFEIYKSSFIHILRIIKKDENPVIVEVELSVENPYLVTMISNAITLTPGTITVDVQGKKLYVLTIKGHDHDHQALQQEIKRKFEAPFIEGGGNW